MYFLDGGLLGKDFSKLQLESKWSKLPVLFQLIFGYKIIRSNQENQSEIHIFFIFNFFVSNTVIVRDTRTRIHKFVRYLEVFGLLRDGFLPDGDRSGYGLRWRV